MRRVLIGLAALGLTAVLAHAAGNTTVTVSCSKDLSSGELNYNAPSGYSVTMVSFSEDHRDGHTAYGSCTLSLRKD
jgi:hypothetical protein